MPSHTPASALIKLYSIGGAPWGWDAWKDRTKIRHGLFPDDDDSLPPGLTRQDVIDIKSYFQAYEEQKSEDDKVTFATKTRGAPAYPGRKTWNDFVSKNWNRWRIHTVIVDELKDWNIHPYDIVLRENLGPAWPASDNFAPIILDTLGLQLFGEDGFIEGTNVLRSDLRALLKIFVQRSWCRIRNHISKVKGRAITTEGTARQAFKDLEDGQPTKTKVNKAIRAVAKWKECAEILNTPQNVKTAEDMIDDLKDIMETLGAKVSPKKTKESKGKLKVSKQALKTLASEEDVTDLLNTYLEYFEMNTDEGDEMPISDSLSAEAQGQLIDDPSVGDFGMEVEKNMDPKQLAKALGFKNCLPVSFNLYRHKFGTSSWDDESLFKFRTDKPLPQFIDWMKLHWHQLAGIHSIVRSIFLEHPDDSHPTGVLIGDEVGLGKTAQSIAFIAFLNQAVYVQNRNLAPPPIIAARPYLGSREVIPSLPHLIVCPGTIAAQWISELKTLFIPWSIDIFLYDSRNNASTFWDPDGPFHTSKHEPHNRVVVATHSVIFSDFKKLHNDPPSRNSRPWMIPPVASKKSTSGTIFGQSFLTVIVDEAHHLRNPGNKHLAMLRVLQQATVRLVMTATPLHTAPKDVASLCRLVGIHHFSDEASYLEEKDDAAVLRRAKKADDDGATLIREQLKIVRRLQKHCVGHFLRRTTVSTDWEGNVLLPLPEPKEIIGLIGLTEREGAIIAERAKAAKDMVESSSKRIQTKKFYLEYRLAVAYAKEDASQLTPRFKTLEEWEPVKSTKMDACARICAHYLTHDHVDDIRFEEGQLIFPDILEIAGVKLPKMRRVIVYSEFPSMAPLLQNVLTLYGVESIVINGEIPFHQRDKRVKEFYDDKHPARVLIFSAVASVGLNLAIADVVIFFDQPWSAQDERQVRGRAHRQPQKKVVRVIHLLAINSADTVMYSVARGKENMFDAFVNKDLADELRDLLQGGLPDDLEDNPALDDEAASERKVKPKRARRRGKHAIATDDPRSASTKIGEEVNSAANDSDDNEKPMPQKPMPKKSRRRAKQKDGHEAPLLKDDSRILNTSEANEGPSTDAANGPGVSDGGKIGLGLTGRVPGISSDADGVPETSEGDVVPSTDYDGMHSTSDGDGLSTRYSDRVHGDEDPGLSDSEAVPITDWDGAQSASDGDALSTNYRELTSDVDLAERLSHQTVDPDSEDDDVPMPGASPPAPPDDDERGTNDVLMRSVSPPSPHSRPPIKRARHGSLDEETRSNIIRDEGPIERPRSSIQKRAGVGSRVTSGGSPSIRQTQPKEIPVIPTDRHPVSRSISNPVPSDNSIPRYNYASPCPKHPGPRLHPAPVPPQQSQPSQRSMLAMAQARARARHQSFMESSGIGPVSRPGSPEQLRPSANSCRDSARRPSSTHPPSTTSTSQHREPHDTESLSITRPRQSGSAAVPPKDALKYTRNRKN